MYRWTISSAGKWFYQRWSKLKWSASWRGTPLITYTFLHSASATQASLDMFVSVLLNSSVVKKVKSSWAQWPTLSELIPVSVAWNDSIGLSIIATPLDGMLVRPLQVTPQPPDCQVVWVIKVSCQRTQHNDPNQHSNPDRAIQSLTCSPSGHHTQLISCKKWLVSNETVVLHRRASKTLLIINSELIKVN